MSTSAREGATKRGGAARQTMRAVLSDSGGGRGRNASVAAIAEAAEARFGRIDHLANCAGVTDRGDVWDTTPELFDTMMAVNVRAPFQLIQAVAHLARHNDRPASVVNVGSVAAYGGAPFITPYSISKGALMTMTKSVAYQLMRNGVRVVTVNPGWMDTPGEDAIQRKWLPADS